MRVKVLLLSLSALTWGACTRPSNPSDTGFQHLATLGDPSGEGALPGMPYVGPKTAGYYLVATPEQPSEELVRVYDSTGHFVGVIGQHGEGPNEYRRPQYIYRINDSAWIYDRTLHRITVMIPPHSSGTTRSWRFPPYSLLPTPDGTFVLSKGIWGSGYPMEHVDALGEPIESFGDTLPSGVRYWRMVHLASASDSGFWSAPPYSQLEFQYWNAPTRLRRSLRLTRDYFPDYARAVPATPTEPPSPELVGFWSDSTDALWIVVRIADSHWPQGLGAGKQAEGSTYYPIDNWDKVFDTVVERVDSRTGASLGMWQVDQAVVRVVEPWVLQSIGADEDGWYQAFLWRVPH